MHKKIFIYICSILLILGGSTLNAQNKNKITKIYLAGDSTVEDYSLDSTKDYMTQRYPQTGWGQVFQEYFNNNSGLKKVLKTDSIQVVPRAKAGRSTRTFFQEGRWRGIYENLKEGDWVLIQFGHNDESEKKVDRYVDIPGFKEYLKLFIHQAQQKKAKPVLITAVSRNYPWNDAILGNSHVEYGKAMIDLANEINIPVIDLNQLSAQHFTKKGKDYVTTNYFMNLEANIYTAYPDGLKDNTHFKPEGAKAVAGIVYEELQKIITQQK